MMKKIKRVTQKERHAFFDYFFSLSEGSYKERFLLTKKWWKSKKRREIYINYQSFRNGKSKYISELSKPKKRYPNN